MCRFILRRADMRPQGPAILFGRRSQIRHRYGHVVQASDHALPPAIFSPYDQRLCRVQAGFVSHKRGAAFTRY